MLSYDTDVNCRVFVTLLVQSQLTVFDMEYNKSVFFKSEKISGTLMSLTIGELFIVENHWDHGENALLLLLTS